MRNLVIVAIFIFTSVSCKKGDTEKLPKDKSPSKDYADDFNNTSLVSELISEIKYKGDTVAYKKLKDIYYYSGHVQDFLMYSIYMSENFEYPSAYFDVYTALHTDIINDNNKQTNKIANYYLFKSFEKGVIHAKYSIKERFGASFKIPDAEKYRIELNKIKTQ